MQKLELSKQEIMLPESWRDVTIMTFKKLILDPNQEGEYLYNVAILSGIDPENLMDMPKKDVDLIVKNLAFMKKMPEHTQDVSRFFDGEKYHFIQSIPDESYGRWLMFEHHIAAKGDFIFKNSENILLFIEDILAFFVTEKTKNKEGERMYFNIKNKPLYEDFILKINVPDALGLYDFFLHKLKESEMYLRTCTKLLEILPLLKLRSIKSGESIIN